MTQTNQQTNQPTQPQLATLYVAIDDTDDISKATSTGYIAELIAQAACARGGQLIHDVTRHQLLLDPSVPYTSHNSAMAFVVNLPEQNIAPFREQAIAIIGEHRASSSDPGLCLATLPYNRKNGLFRRQRRDLIDFGNAAIRVYCSQQKAYDLANEIPWVTLSAHGGDGQGVVGALAAIGLRLSGNNGRFRGSIDLSTGSLVSKKSKGQGDGGGGSNGSGGGGNGSGIGSGSGNGNSSGRDKVQATDQVSTVASVCERLSSQLGGEVSVVDGTHQVLSGNTKILLSRNVKAILKNHAYTIIANLQDGVAAPLGKTDLDEIFPKETELLQFCRDFTADTDNEERVGLAEQTCVSCLYRRWEAEGFSCVVRH